MSKKKIYIIDGNSFVYRMFYGVPEFTTKDGKPVNAIFGITNFFKTMITRDKPDYLIFVRDAKGKNFRHDLHKEYKATRDRMPDDLKSQMDDIDLMVSKMGIDIIAIPGFEADDVIGTLATKLSKNIDFDIFILSGDKDLFSLVKENVKIYDTMKKKISGIAETIEKFKIEPKYVIDYLAIVGDKADNIPGISGVGPKKVEKLINDYGTVEKIYECIANMGEKGDEFIKGKFLEKMIDGKESAFLSKKLATIDLDVKIPDFKLENYFFKGRELFNDDVIKFCRELEFFSIIGENREKNLKKWSDLGLKVNIINTDDKLLDLYSKISKSKKIIIDTETTSLNVYEAKIVGVSIYIDDENIYYINVLHTGDKVSIKEFKKFLKDIFELDILVVGHNLKYDLEIIDLFLKGENSENNTGELDSQISLDF